MAIQSSSSKLRVNTLSEAQYCKKFSRIPPHLTSSDTHCLKCHSPPLFFPWIALWIISSDCLLSKSKDTQDRVGGQDWHPHLIVVASEVNSGIWFTIGLGNGFKVIDTSHQYILFSRKSVSKCKVHVGLTQRSPQWKVWKTTGKRRVWRRAVDKIHSWDLEGEVSEGERI